MSAAALLGLSLGLAATPTFANPKPAAPPTFALVGDHNTGLASISAGFTAAETVAYAEGRMYVTTSSALALDVVSIADPAARQLLKRIDLSPYGAGPNSVAVARGLVAVAVEASPKTDPGAVVFFSLDGEFHSKVTVGALPDMLTFTPNGQFLLVANEGEPSDDYKADPYGSISAVKITGDPEKISDADVTTMGFAAFNGAVAPGVRIFGPGASDADGVQKNLEPEYITVDDDGRTAYVTLQEANAIATVDLSHLEIVAVTPLGLKDHVGNEVSGTVSIYAAAGR
ncbi:MAG: hypothetical protein HGA45_24935 [Chloroflexales bacterium]|nr:hypothetical protein [Chloroflexales bacterium]